MGDQFFFSFIELYFLLYNSLNLSSVNQGIEDGERFLLLSRLSEEHGKREPHTLGRCGQRWIPRGPILFLS